MNLHGERRTRFINDALFGIAWAGLVFWVLYAITAIIRSM